MSLSDQIYSLRTRGYVQIPGAITAARVSGLAAMVDRLADEDDLNWGKDRLAAMGQRGALRNLCDQDPVFEELLADSPIYGVIDEVLGSDYLLHSYDALVLFPGDGRFPWDFHTDMTPLSGLAFPAGRSVGVNCLYYLADITVENGATHIVPASHRCVLPQPEVEVLSELAIPATGRAGDALLFDARLWHCSGTNLSGKRRAVIKAFFCPPWLRPQMDYARAVRPEVLRRLDDRTRHLLGVGNSPPATVEALRAALAR